MALRPSPPNLNALYVLIGDEVWSLGTPLLRPGCSFIQTQERRLNETVPWLPPLKEDACARQNTPSCLL